MVFMSIIATMLVHCKPTTSTGLRMIRAVLKEKGCNIRRVGRDLASSGKVMRNMHYKKTERRTDDDWSRGLLKRDPGSYPVSLLPHLSGVHMQKAST